MFERITNLIKEEDFNKLKTKKILIVGCGGVGGYALETLVRSGIIYIDIIDHDKIDITNLNRQIITTQENINKYKVDEAKKRAIKINPNVIINTYKLFLDEHNIDEILKNNYNFIIDACDYIPTKIELIKRSIKNNFKLISCMGTAKKIDPTKLSITTLDKTKYDPLAKIIRKKIKELKITKKIIVVSSEEEIIKSEYLGSFMMVPATAGILCAKYVLKNIIDF